MSKRQKIWWFGGGGLLFIALYSVTAYFVTWNSPEAKLERTLDAIIAENGLVFKANTVYEDTDWTDYAVDTEYIGEPISQEHEKLIRDQLSEFCPPFTFLALSRNQDNMYTRTPTSEPTFDVSVWNSKRDAGLVTITVIFNDRGVTGGDSPSSRLEILRIREVQRSLFEKFWPW